MTDPRHYIIPLKPVIDPRHAFRTTEHLSLDVHAGYGGQISISLLNSRGEARWERRLTRNESSHLRNAIESTETIAVLADDLEPYGAPEYGADGTPARMMRPTSIDRRLEKAARITSDLANLVIDRPDIASDLFDAMSKNRLLREYMARYTSPDRDVVVVEGEESDDLPPAPPVLPSTSIPGFASW